MRRAVVSGAMAAALVLAALAAPVGARHTAQRDPNDTRGRLDLASVVLDHGSGTPEWRFVTFGGWSVREVWDTGHLVVMLDTRGDEAADHFLVVRSDGRKLVAALYRVRNDGSQVSMGAVAARKAGPHRAEVSVALHKLSIGRARSAYHWAAMSTFTAAACRRTCIDRVPDQGMVEQLLPGVTPSPTPSPSPTVSPSPTPTVSPSPTPTP